MTEERLKELEEILELMDVSLETYIVTPERYYYPAYKVEMSYYY